MRTRRLMLAVLVVGLGCSFIPELSWSQNLLANGGFEEVNICTEFRAPCSPAGWFIVTAGSMSLPAKSGVRTMPFIYDNVVMPIGNRSFPYTRVLCPLVPGKEYNLSFWLNADGFDFTQLDVVLSRTDPTRTASVLGKITPSLVLTKDDIAGRDAHGWILLQKKFTVEEEKDFFLMGNVLAPGEYPRSEEKKAKKQKGFIIFFLDEIRLFSTDSLANSCPLYAENRAVLYEEHRRHSRGIFLDTLKTGAVPGLFVAAADSPAAVEALRRDTMVLPGFLFAFDSAGLDRAYISQLDSIAAMVDARRPVQILISGYTDNAGSDEYNRALSLRRAEAVKNYLSVKLPALKMQASGYGSRRPLASNATPEGRAGNRRVEIVLLY